MQKVWRRVNVLNVYMFKNGLRVSGLFLIKGTVGGCLWDKIIQIVCLVEKRGTLPPCEPSATSLDFSRALLKEGGTELEGGLIWNTLLSAHCRDTGWDQKEPGSWPMLLRCFVLLAQ